MKFCIKSSLLFVICLIAVLPTRAFAVTDNAVIRWDKVTLEAIRVVKPGPPMVARALAIVHTAMFDAWATYDPIAYGTRFGDNLRRPFSERTAANKAKAISFAAYRALLDLFPTQKTVFETQMISLGYDPFDASTDPTTASGIGNQTARSLIEFRHNDGSNQLNGYVDTSGYAPLNDPDVVTDLNHWQPLRLPDGKGGFVVQKFVAPHWGNVTPFALATGSEFRPGPPAIYPSPEFAAQARAVVDSTAGLTEQQKVIAEYWADGPASELPPGHWCLFAQQISTRDNHDVDKDVTLFFALSNAVFDAGIAAWDAKRIYDSVRPITAIRLLFKDQTIRTWGGKTVLGQDWLPYQVSAFPTPPFAEYISGHSLFSAAAAEVLKLSTGSDTFGGSATVLAGSSKVEPALVPSQDVTLSWATFSDAADEAGLSRRYGGIHFADGDLHSREIGRKVGAKVWVKAQSYINGQDRNVSVQNSGGGCVLDRRAEFDPVILMLGFLAVLHLSTRKRGPRVSHTHG